ncbi:MAG: hypothetical protein ACKOF7_00435 [Phycisphaerales bacterium]
MQHPVARYAVLVLGVAACILLALPVLPWLTSARGVAGPGASDAVHTVPAAVAMVVGAAAFTAVACVVGRLINAAVGLFVLGCGLAVVAGRTGTVVDAAFDGDTLMPLACETLAWGAAVLGMSMVVFKVSGPLIDLPARKQGGPFVAEVFNADAWRGVIAAAAAVAVAWLLLRNETKGQAIGVVAVGGVAAAYLARRVQQDTQPILLMALPVIAFGIAQAIVAASSVVPLDRLVAQRALPGWSMAMPLDVVAGTLIGVPIGLGWSKPSDGSD